MIQHELAINADVRSIICTHILDSVGEVLGYFDIRNKQDGEGFTISDQEMLMALAPAASIAIQNALAYQQRLTTVAELKESSRQLQALAANLELAREEERTQIARELHDDIGQQLAFVESELVELKDQVDDMCKSQVVDLESKVSDVSRHVRELSHGLHPSALQHLGLEKSLKRLCRDMSALRAIDVDFECKDLDPEPVATIALCLYRIAQEGLQNVIHHSGASQVSVRVTGSKGLIRLVIRDNGCGFQNKDVADTGMGLTGMRERLRAVKGELRISSRPRHGTTLDITIPLGDLATQTWAPK
jgi:two-component system sensor histidine kinase UhpB